jgi:hypothetical protein
MKRFLLAGAMALGVSLSAGLARADLIDLSILPDGLAADPLVYPDVSFTTLGGGFNVIASGQGLCTSTSPVTAADCSDALQVDFTTPSAPISFVFFDNNDQTIGDNIGNVSLFAGATHLGDVGVLVTDTSPFTPDLVSLSAFTGVTRMVVTTTDFGGVVYNDFDFTPGPSRTPEPGAWILAILGFGMAGAALRRRDAIPA